MYDLEDSRLGGWAALNRHSLYAGRTRYFSMQKTGMVELTPLARDKLFEAITKANVGSAYLRIEAGGGCACCGPGYEMSLVKEAGAEDVVEEVDGIRIVSSKQSAELLRGSKIDYYEGLEGSGFMISNPNMNAEHGSCGCGDGDH